jgi:hypothetical protein
MYLFILLVKICKLNMYVFHFTLFVLMARLWSYRSETRCIFLKYKLVGFDSAMNSLLLNVAQTQLKSIKLVLSETVEVFGLPPAKFGAWTSDYSTDTFLFVFLNSSFTKHPNI